MILYPNISKNKLKDWQQNTTNAEYTILQKIN